MISPLGDGRGQTRLARLHSARIERQAATLGTRELAVHLWDSLRKRAPTGGRKRRTRAMFLYR